MAPEQHTVEQLLGGGVQASAFGEAEWTRFPGSGLEFRLPVVAPWFR